MSFELLIILTFTSSSGACYVISFAQNDSALSVLGILIWLLLFKSRSELYNIGLIGTESSSKSFTYLFYGVKTVFYSKLISFSKVGIPDLPLSAAKLDMTCSIVTSYNAFGSINYLYNSKIICSHDISLSFNSKPFYICGFHSGTGLT